MFKKMKKRRNRPIIRRNEEKMDEIYKIDKIDGINRIDGIDKCLQL